MMPAALKSFLDRNGLFDNSMTDKDNTSGKRVIDDPRSPTVGICRTPIMVESPILEKNVLQLSDPRSPTVDILRTPIQIIDDLETLQLEDPRSPTIGMIRTPIQISDSTEVIELEQTSTPDITATKTAPFTVSSPCASPNIRNRKKPVSSTQDVAKKLLFSATNTATDNLIDTPVKNRKPLGLVCGNRLQTNSPLHIIRSKQLVSVEQAMFKSVVPASHLDLENTPPSRRGSEWDGRDSTFRI